MVSSTDRTKIAPQEQFRKGETCYVVFPGDVIHGLWVQFMGWAHGYPWVKSLEERFGYCHYDNANVKEHVKIGDVFVWRPENLRKGMPDDY